MVCWESSRESWFGNALVPRHCAGGQVSSWTATCASVAGSWPAGCKGVPPSGRGMTSGLQGPLVLSATGAAGCVAASEVRMHIAASIETPLRTSQTNDTIAWIQHRSRTAEP